MNYELIGYFVIHGAGITFVVALFLFMGALLFRLLHPLLEWLGDQIRVKEIPLKHGAVLKKFGPTITNGSIFRNVGLWLVWTEKEKHD